MEAYVANLRQGSCSDGEPGRGTWTRLDQEKGPLACYLSADGSNTIAWGSDETGVLVYAYDSSMTPLTLYQWWTTTPVIPD